MIDVPQPQTFSQQLAEMQAFAETKFSPLLPKLQHVKMAIYRGYSLAGKPDGKGKYNAMAWFDKQWDAWQKAQGVIDVMSWETAQQQLLEMGDLAQKGEEIRPTKKGLARGIVLSFSTMVNTADIEERQLTDLEVLSMKHQLIVTLAEIGAA